MSTEIPAPSAGTTKPGALSIERTGIEIVPESDRTAKPRDLFWPWFAANVSVFGMSYGSFVLGFGISFWQATVVSIIGIETFYGRNTGSYRVIDALSTLGFDYPPRAEFFRKELREFLLLAREEQVDDLAA